MRLVVHAGAEYVDAGTITRDLIRNRERLASAGVALPAGDDQAVARATLAVVRGEEAGRDVLAEARASGAVAVVLSSDLAADVLAAPERAARFAEFAAVEQVEAQVVVALREQIGYINALYCRRVLNLDTARPFPEFAALAEPMHRFDYVASFGAVADTDGLGLVAVPYPEVVEKGAVRAVLSAAGFDATVVESVAAEPLPELPGPVLVGAVRLLHKRMRRLNAITEQGRGPLRRYVAELAARAREASWDSAEFWGWEVPLRRAAEEEYEASNAAFAEYVWGSPWPEPFSAGQPNRVDLPALPPRVLQDVLDTVDRLVDAAATAH